MRGLAAFVFLAAPLLLAQDPMDAQGWLDRGVAEFKSGRYSQAAADFQRAVDSDPSNVNAHLYLATAWVQQYIPGAESPDNRTAAAVADRESRKVLELDPGNEKAMLYLASLNLYQKRWDEAQAWYQKVADTNPQNAQAWYSRGFIAWSRWYPAEQAARAKLGMRPEDPGPLPASDIKTDLIASYQPIIESGSSDLQRALEIDPQYDDAMAYMNLLIRGRADLRDNVADYQHDIDDANSWVDKAMAAKKAEAKQRAAEIPAPPLPGGGRGDRRPPQRIRVSGAVMAAIVIHHDPPVYPQLAKSAGVSGTVVLSVVVGPDGTVQEVRYLTGPSLLARAAMDAVRNWTYKPTILNTEPVEVETTVEVNFSLQN
jgi:TonB family protein